LSKRVLHATQGQVSKLFENRHLRLVIGGADDSVAAWSKQKLAQLDGSIVPYLSIVDHHQLVRLLLQEKVISIDTTAAGGNASLLNAAGRDEGLPPMHGAAL